jgi:hypothetical protein
VYQGILEPSQFIRFSIPVPKEPLKHSISIKATFCIFAPVDPEDSWNYTRAGLGIVFRPKTTGHPGLNAKGKERDVHEADGFFSGGLYQSSEIQKRKDAHKWATVLRAEKHFEPGVLDQPVFDVEHHTRVHGQPSVRRTDIAYSLIVTLSSKEEPDLFNRILAAYPNLLAILRPAIAIEIR